VFNAPTPKQFTAGQAIGFTMVTQVYVRPGELAYRTDETPPKTATRLRATVFWMGLAPLRLGKRYKLKLGANRVPVELVRVHSLLDATSLSTSAGITQVSRHEVAEVELETLRPVAFDPADVDERTARFVLVDGYDIAGCGVILSGKTEEDSLLAQRLAKRARTWKHSLVTAAQRRSKLGQTGKFVVFTGPDDAETAKTLHQRAQALEAQLFAHGRQTAFLSIADLFADLADGHEVGSLDREEHLDLLGELAHAMTEAGLIVIGALPGADTSDLERLRQINQPNDLTVVLIGDNEQDINADLRLDHLETETPDLIAIEDHLLQSGIFTQNQRK
jgi:bifunctional enzyme CysN/CysC